MDVDLKIQNLEITFAELRKDVDDLRKATDDVKNLAVELAVMKSDLAYIKEAQTRLNANANKVVLFIVGAFVAQFAAFVFAGGLMTG